jgi:serine/threonine protein phosphatase 1
MGFFSFGARVSPPETAPARVPDGVRVYAVGDVHGRVDLYDALAYKVACDLRDDPCVEPVAIFLGDYIDRGPDSFGVIDRLAKGFFPAPIVALRGNHEAILLQFLENDSVLNSWRRYGALETLMSYGVDIAEPLRGRGYKEAQEQLREALPREHLAFLEETHLSLDVGDYFFCHAGVRPDVPFEQQEERDLLWIREEFIGFSGALEKVVVHGHTPFEEPRLAPYQIGIDTGAYATGRLSCLVLEGANRRWITA